ncbi:hypothetical protein P5P86_18190 [Nocardioides sp. BP30]|uniref:hypothetical protein n=1 Tax=Nocardioides sp. BP30 TaxID=3036374 RepID=UPI0024683DA0|nr:hypothetical protein [Nocardioides sp. BP30]WGL51872.1 hypothetical protein P5P86_18190 [Nocardioides sp. BP30]
MEPTTYSFSYSALGTTLNGTLQLAGPMRANDPALASTWSSIVPSAPSSVGCGSDSSDAVVVGGVTFDVPTYAGGNLAFSIQKPQVGELLDMEMDFSNQPVSYCDGPQSFPINPTIQGSTWGPVPIAFTIPKAYGFDGLNQAIYKQAARGLWFREQRVTNYAQLTYAAGQNMTSKGVLPDTLSFDLPGVN